MAAGGVTSGALPQCYNGMSSWEHCCCRHQGGRQADQASLAAAMVVDPTSLCRVSRWCVSTAASGASLVSSSWSMVICSWTPIMRSCVTAAASCSLAALSCSKQAAREISQAA